MDAEKTEMRELTRQLHDLNARFKVPQGNHLESKELTSYLNQISTIRKEILQSQEKIRGQKVEILLQNRIPQSKGRLSLYELTALQLRISSLKETNESLKANYIQKLDHVAKTFQGKASLCAMLKRLAQKEKEKIDLKTRINALKLLWVSLNRNYYEITKKLAEDNTLTLKIKYLEENNPKKIESVNCLRKKLGKIRADVQEIKLNCEEDDLKFMRRRIAELKKEEIEGRIVKEEAKRMINEVEAEIKKFTSEGNKIVANEPYEEQKTEIKNMESQIAEKEREITIYLKEKKNLTTKFKSSNR
jgi:hypothetical protein